MANLLDTLRIGGNSMAAQQVAAQVAGNNISNANVPGYHRQDAVIIGMAGLGGVRDTQVQRAVNSLLEAQLTEQRGAASFAQDRAQGLEFVVQAVGDLSSSGLNGALSDMFSAVRNLTISPSDLSVRSSVVSAGQALTSRFNVAANALENAQQASDASVVAALPGINANLQAIASLNAALAQSANAPEQSASLLDQRDAVLAELSSQAGATSSIEANGSMTVFIANISVVSEIASYVLQAEPNLTTGLSDIAVAGTSHTAIQSEISGGTLGGELTVRDQDIANAKKSLDQVAYDMATAFNTVHKNGFDLDGNTNNNLFAPLAAVTDAASALSLDAAILASPRAIATAQSALTTPGDNSVALSLSDLERQNVTTGNTQTLSTALAGLVSTSGQALSIARVSAQQTETLLHKTEALFEAQAGVSVDEQMLMLSRIQNAHQASAKLIEVTNHMLDAIQNL